MEHWPWQMLVAGKCTGTAWGQVCPQLRPVRKVIVSDYFVTKKKVWGAKRRKYGTKNMSRRKRTKVNMHYDRGDCVHVMSGTVCVSNATYNLRCTVKQTSGGHCTP